jgi:hypothetical protein
MQDLANVVRLALTDHHFEGLAESEEPALAAERAHLADVVQVDQGIAVNALKLAGWKPLFNPTQRLRGQQARMFPQPRRFGQSGWQSRGAGGAGCGPVPPPFAGEHPAPLQQIVDGAGLERRHGVLVEGFDDDDA